MRKIKSRECFQISTSGLYFCPNCCPKPVLYRNSRTFPGKKDGGRLCCSLGEMSVPSVLWCGGFWGLVQRRKFVHSMVTWCLFGNPTEMEVSTCRSNVYSAWAWSFSQTWFGSLLTISWDLCTHNCCSVLCIGWLTLEVSQEVPMPSFDYTPHIIYLLQSSHIIPHYLL